jgi:serine/threonine protein kinase
MSLSTGQILENRYQIDALLGQGGMGAVYRATDLRFNALVAIKENRLVSAESQKQFTREAGLLYRLRHPNLPRVIDHFSIPYQGQYLVMDYVQGDDLRQIIAHHGAVPEAQALGWIGQVLDALEYLHSEQIIHRDVKPANVKITPQGAVFLVDFGLAKVYDPLQQTTMGARGVTPGYAPPEQYGQGRTDARSDVYSSAATLYALVTGQTPPDALESMIRQEELRPPRQINAHISQHIEDAILKAMKRDPDARFQTVAGLRAALLEPPTHLMGAEVEKVQPHKMPAREPGPAAAQETPAPPAPAKQARAAPKPKRPEHTATPGLPAVVAAPGRINRRRVVILGLLAAFLGAFGAILGGEVIGHLAVVFIVLGLIIHHARRISQNHPHQYQMEVLSLWLGVVLGYLVFAGSDRQLNVGSLLLGTAVMFWLPTAIVGAVTLRLARRRAEKKAA